MKTRLILTTMVLLVLVGCRRAETPDPAAAQESPLPVETVEAEPEPSPSQELWAEVNRLFSEGETNACLVLLDSALTNEVYENDRSVILRDLMGIHLRAGMSEEAKDKYLAVAASDPELAGSAYGVLESFMQWQNDFTNLISWSESLLEFEFSETVQGQIYGTLLNANRSLANWDRLLELLAQSKERFPVEQSRAIASRLLDTMLRAKEYEPLDRALALLEQSYPGDTEVIQMVTLNRFWSRLNQDQLDLAAEGLSKAMDDFPPAQVTRPFNAFVRKAAASQEALAERFCIKALDEKGVEDPLFRAAASQWVNMARSKEDPALVQKRLVDVQTRGTPFGLLLSLVNRSFYFVIEKGDIDTRKGLLKICDDLYSQTEDEDNQAQIAAMLLDGSFMVDDFDRARALVERGIPGRDANWHAILLPKVKAHQALAAGKTREAIGHFRQFMKVVPSSEEKAVDPFTGNEVPVEVILGLNAARIAGLWASIDDAEKASAAYKEAREYYEKALSETKEGSEEYEHIQESLKALPEET